jgi:hypothetical protein
VKTPSKDLRKIQPTGSASATPDAHWLSWTSTELIQGRLYYGPRDDSTRWDALVADVHTDPMSGVLHQAVGNVDVMVIAIDNGKDRMIFLGPTMSHYEFDTFFPALQRRMSRIL